MSLNCYYHPEREAISKCENCGIILCLECKMVYRRVIRRGTGDSSYTYSERYDYCPICFYDKKIKKHGLGKMIKAIIVTIIIIVMISVVNDLISPFMGYYFYMMNFFFVTLPLIIMVGFNIYVFIYSPIKLREIKRKKEQILNSLKTITPLGQERVATKFCSECVISIDPEVSFCSYCGTTIKIRV